MSLPLTTRLSLDFRKSLVIISDGVSHRWHVDSMVTRPTITTGVEIHDTPNPNVHDAQKALILLLELLLVEYLHGEDAFVVDAPV